MNEDKNLNDKLMQILGGLDKEKLEKVTNMVKGMSPQDLSNLAQMMGINTNNNNGK